MIVSDCNDSAHCYNTLLLTEPVTKRLLSKHND